MSVVEEKAASIISKVGLWWPLAGPAPLVSSSLSDRNLHTTITTQSARIIKRGGAQPIVFPPGSKLLVVSREYVKDSGHFIHLEDASHLDEVELFVRLLPDGL